MEAYRGLGLGLGPGHGWVKEAGAGLGEVKEAGPGEVKETSAGPGPGRAGSQNPSAGLGTNGATEPQHHPRLRNDGMSTVARLPRFDGTWECYGNFHMPWECYEAQLNAVEHHLSWTAEDTVLQISLVLEGEALQVLLDVPESEHSKLELLKTALHRRFSLMPPTEQQRCALRERKQCKGERVSVLPVKLSTLARQPYPRFPEEAQQELALEAFINALTSKRLQKYLQLAAPLSLADAVREAEHAEPIVCCLPSTTPLTLCHATEVEEEAVVQRVTQDRQIVCWQCRKRGHHACHCKEVEPAGNNEGAGQ
ncbi:hypothetical protein SRHO_G00072450 [Serrasalmus rhombeus]